MSPKSRNSLKNPTIYRSNARAGRVRWCGVRYATAARVLRVRRKPEQTSATAIADAIESLTGGRHDYDSLLDLVGAARFVLIGEASHGTHEFYAERAAITRRLITEKSFAGVCIEGDWPDAYRVDCYFKGRSDDRSAEEALEGFSRFPTWMRRNEVVRDFVAWARELNDGRPEHSRVGFYGLDLYGRCRVRLVSRRSAVRTIPP